MTPVLRKISRGLVLGAAAVVAWLSTHRLWQFDELAPGQSESGYFEASEGSVGLALYPPVPDEILHAAGLDVKGRVSVPPGSVVALPIPDPVSYRVLADEDVPYVVVGSAMPSASDPAGQPRRWMVGSRTFAAGEKGIADPISWCPSEPWPSDERRLEALRVACGVGRRAAELEVSRQGREIALTLGTCTKRIAIDAEAGGELVMAVIAGPSWSFVSRTDRSFSTRPAWYSGLATTLLVTLLSVPLVLGWQTGSVVYLVVVGTALINPGVAVLCVWAALIVTIGALVVRIPRGVTVGLALVLAYFLLHRVSSENENPVNRSEGMHCLLTGYSAAAGVGVVAGGGLLEELQTCDVCNGSAGRYAKGGETFEFVEEMLCKDRAPLPPGTDVVFYGAANDDLMAPGNSGKLVSLLWRVLFHARENFSRRPGIESLTALVDAASVRTLDAKDRLTHLLESAWRCARDRKLDVFFVHDMLAIDMPRGRGAARRALLDMRRATVESGGGVFIDMEDALRERIGVSWFTDPIHLSSVGQREVGRYVCERMRRGRSGDGGGA